MLGIDRVFVLMLENRSLDHMLGYSGLSGTDAVTGAATGIIGLTGNESNSFNGETFFASSSAEFTMEHDPLHEFTDVVVQLAGKGAVYTAGKPYPKITSTGFAESFGAKYGGAGTDRVMACFPPAQVPVLAALAREFAVCDQWFCSLPGPTWPNRMFAHAASSAGLEHSPSIPEIVDWEITGYHFPNGTIFDAIKASGLSHRIYAGDDFPMVAALHGVGLEDHVSFSNFSADVQSPDYNIPYTFIEPSYDVLGNYRNGTSQHPLGDVRRGEELIKQVYEAVRQSPHWNTSLLIVTWDEHGGFYDHFAPPAAIAPGDSPDPKYNQSRFAFDQYGPRVPAIVVSPLIPKNVIDHRVYDHASIPATLEKIFALKPLTARDARANSLDALLTLASPRTDAPMQLPNTVPLDAGAVLSAAAAPTPASATTSANHGNIPVVVSSALHQDLQMSPHNSAAILAKVRNIKTAHDAEQYLNEVSERKRAFRRTAGH